MCADRETTAATFSQLSTDRFGGVIVHSANESSPETSSASAFAATLSRALREWTANRRIRIVWFHVARKCGHWLPALCANEFRFHRASDDGDTAVMYRWMAACGPCPVPPYAHTMVGVGGIVLNANEELLAVLQRFGAEETLKLPGGYVEPGEELSDAAVREVHEETGVKTTFLSCASFRHTHHANFDCSDLYFIVHLQPITTAVSTDCDEVIDARWIPIDDFLKHPQVNRLNRLFVESFLTSKRSKISIAKHDAITAPLQVHSAANKPFPAFGNHWFRDEANTRQC